jgi:hypothetical protein
MEDLPRGIWYELERRRYRIRIYRNQIVKHLSYHKTLEEAERTLEMFKATADPKTDLIERLINQTKLFYKQKPRR